MYILVLSCTWRLWFNLDMTQSASGYKVVTGLNGNIAGVFTELFIEAGKIEKYTFQQRYVATYVEYR